MLQRERVGGLLLTVCIESLVPLQRELGFIEAVRLEPSDEEFFLPYGNTGGTRGVTREGVVFPPAEDSTAP